MTVQELMQELEDFEPDTEVRLAIQPNYPFQHTIAQVIEVEVEPTCEEDGDETQTVVYIAEGGQLYEAPYLPGEVSQDLGWR